MMLPEFDWAMSRSPGRVVDFALEAYWLAELDDRNGTEFMKAMLAIRHFKNLGAIA